MGGGLFLGHQRDIGKGRAQPGGNQRVGGLVGLGFSVLVSAVMNALIAPMLGFGMNGDDTSISVIPPWLALGAIAFSTAIGTLAGLAPAQRAVRLSPLDAIRSQ